MSQTVNQVIKPKTMRDIFIEGIYERMKVNKNIFFLSADMGAPALDKVRRDFPNQFFNTGIAEQNLISMSSGLALEGYTVYCMGIAPFVSMRSFEQIRLNLSIMSHLRKINVNILSIGAGFSYDVSGPTHHCVEDLSLIRILPNVHFFSPSDTSLVERYIDYSLEVNTPKYLRFDGKPVTNIYNSEELNNYNFGFIEHTEGEKICLISTGHMTHKAISVINKLKNEGINIGLVDLYFLKNYDREELKKALSKYKFFITLEEAFINKGGLDSLVFSVFGSELGDRKISAFGLSDVYYFENAKRNELHKHYGMDEENIIKEVKSFL